MHCFGLSRQGTFYRVTILKSSSELLSDTSDCEVVSLAYNDPRIKPKMMLAFVEECLKLNYQIDYLDFDLQFSSLLQNMPESESKELSSAKVRVFQPGPNVTDIVTSVADSHFGRSFLVIDSLNTVQNLLSRSPSPTDLKSANHRSAIFVSSMQQLARTNSQTILALNLTKSRPKKSNDSGVIWERELVGGRMTRYKSDAILSAKEFSDNENQSIRIRVQVNAVYSSKFKGSERDEYEIQINGS